MNRVKITYNTNKLLNKTCYHSLTPDMVGSYNCTLCVHFKGITKGNKVHCTYDYDNNKFNTSYPIL